MTTAEPLSPAVSVCIAVYNHARFLHACLDSVLEQTFQNFEIIAVDDGSPDGSFEILKEYQRRFPEKVKALCHEDHANKGVSATTNAAIRASRGRFIAFIGSDDIWYPDKLERQVALLEAYPEMGMAYSKVNFINDEGERLPGEYGVNITEDSNPTGRMLLFCHTPAITVIMRRIALNDPYMFDEKLTYSDWDLMIRTFARWKVGHIDEPLADYRLHQTNLSHGNRPDVERARILAVMQAVERRAEDVGGDLLLPENKALLNLQLAFLHFCHREVATAESYLFKAQQTDPSLGKSLVWVKEWLLSLQYSFYTPKLPHFGFWLASRPPFYDPSINKNGLLHWLLESEDTRQFFIQRGLEKLIPFEEVDGIFNDMPVNILLPEKWKKSVLNELFPTLLFSTYKSGDYIKARSYWWQTVTKNPRWLRNRGILSIGLRIFSHLLVEQHRPS